MTIRIESLEQQIELEDTFVNEVKVGDFIYRGTIGPCDFKKYQYQTKFFYLSLEKIQRLQEEKKRHNPPINDTPAEKVIWKLKTESEELFEDLSGCYAGIHEIALQNNILLSNKLIKKIFQPLEQKVIHLREEFEEYRIRLL